jgi:hypothetical protein
MNRCVAPLLVVSLVGVLGVLAIGAGYAKDENAGKAKCSEATLEGTYLFSKRAWAKSVRRWASGKRQINRWGHRSTQGHPRPGAPQGEDARWSFGPLGGQDGGLHLRAAAQRPAWATAAPPSRPFGLSDYASLVLEV